MPIWHTAADLRQITTHTQPPIGFWSNRCIQVRRSIIITGGGHWHDCGRLTLIELKPNFCLDRVGFTICVCISNHLGLLHHHQGCLQGLMILHYLHQQLLLFLCPITTTFGDSTVSTPVLTNVKSNSPQDFILKQLQISTYFPGKSTHFFQYNFILD